MPILKNASERAKNLTESLARQRANKVAAPAPAPAPGLKNAFERRAERAKNLTESLARQRANKVAPKVPLDPSVAAAQAARKPPRGPVSAPISDREQTTYPGMKSGGSVAKASKRADGIAKKGKTRGKFI